MSRHSLMLAVLLSVTALASVEAQSNIIVVNVSAWDCPPCITWANNQKRPWLASEEYKKVRYFEIEAPTIRQAFNARYWPDEIKSFAKKVHGPGVPRFLIIRNGEIVSEHWGKWDNTLSDLKKILTGP